MWRARMFQPFRSLKGACVWYTKGSRRRDEVHEPVSFFIFTFSVHISDRSRTLYSMKACLSGLV